MKKSKKILAKDSVQFMIENILNPLNIEVNSNLFLNSSNDEETVLNEIQNLLLNFISKLFIKKELCRNWLKNSTIIDARMILELNGFSTDNFDLEKSSKDNLICFLYLLWKSDLFNNLYLNYLPSKDSYLSPFGLNLWNDYENDNNNNNKINSLNDFNILLKSIERLYNSINSKLQVLNDLEFEREQLYIKINNLKPNISIIDLNLISNSKILQNHIKELENFNKNNLIKNIINNEKIFWKWAFNILELKEFNNNKNNFNINFQKNLNLNLIQNFNKKSEEIKIELIKTNELIKNNLNENNYSFKEIFNNLNNLNFNNFIKKNNKINFIIPELNLNDFNYEKLFNLLNLTNNEILNYSNNKLIKNKIKKLSNKLNLQMI